MSESDLNARLMKQLHRSRLDPQRVENAVSSGCPDIEFVGGWIESKFLRRWPKRPGLIVQCKHFTTAQRSWHVSRHAAHGLSWIVLEVAGELLVLDGLTAAKHFGRVPRDTLTKLAVLHLIPYNPESLEGLGSWFKQRRDEWLRTFCSF